VQNHVDVAISGLPSRATMTVPEVAEVLGVAPWTVYKAVREGTFPIGAIRVGRLVLFATARIAELLGTGYPPGLAS
jgi:excisionase family DNA binding protein